MKKKFLAVLVLFIPFYSSAQEYGTLMNLNPVSPNAAQLFKTWDKPIGTYTGILPINIPIHTPSRLGVTLPITLNYTGGGGIKVEEIASPVGLGWNLSAGGMITRIKKGLTDETTAYGYLDCTVKPTTFEGSYEQLSAYSENLFDLEPDVFLFSFNDVSGRFSFGIDRNIYILEGPFDLIIKPVWKVDISNDSTFAGFTITDTKGDTYYFGTNKDNSYHIVNQNLTEFYDNGWPLVQICNMNRQEIASLQYLQKSYSYETKAQSYITQYFGCCTVDGCGSGDYGGIDVNTLLETSESYISQINMGGDKVIFTYGDNRLDLQGAYRLNKIEIKDDAGNLRKQFNLNYSYFIAPGATEGTNDYDNYYKRLKLLNIAELPSSGTDSLTHSFTYNETNMLPDRLSNSTDYWGFYNGASNSYSNIPNGIYNFGGSAIVDGYADRRTHHEYTGANVLDRITFPSGGYQQYTYEGNRVKYGTYVAQENLWCDEDDYIDRDFEGTTFDNSDPINTPAYSHDFTISSDEYASAFYFYLIGWADNMFVKIIDKNGSWETVFAEFDNVYSAGILLPNGNYRLELYYDENGSFFDVYSFWKELHITSSSYREVGGLRIKRVDNYDPLTNAHQYTDYKYFSPTDTTLESGSLIALPRTVSQGGCPGRNCDLKRITSYSAYPLNVDNGSYVCYTDVRTIESGNGYIDRKFTFEPDNPLTADFPIVASISNRSLRGKLITAKYYYESGTLLKEDSLAYHYPTPLSPTTYGIKIAINRLDPYNPLYCIGDAEAAPGWEPMVETEWSWNYSQGGSSYQTKTDYVYFDDLAKTSLKKTTITRSGKTTETWYRYPFNNNTDYKLPLSVSEKSMKDTLVKYNCLQPLEIITYLKKGSSDSVFISGVKTTFDYFNTDKKHRRSIKQFVSLADSTVFNFTNYDTDANLREQYKENEAREVYLWGYNYKYIVAKVVGSDYNTVFALINNTVLQNPSSEAALRSELNNIRTGLAGSKALVTTYTYLPAVGVSSVTDPAGRITYYEYDLHGRLLRVRDQDKNILKKITYNTNQ